MKQNKAIEERARAWIDAHGEHDPSDRIGDVGGTWAMAGFAAEEVAAAEAHAEAAERERSAAKVAEGEAMLALESAEHRLARALVAGAVLLRRARAALSVLCTAADEDDRDTLRGFGQKAADVRAALASLSCGGDAPPDATAALAEAFGWAVETGTGARMTEERAADLARRWIEGEGR